MSIRTMSLIFDAHFDNIEYVTSGGENKVLGAPVAKLVLLALADHANDEGRGAYPSVNRLVRKTDLTRRTIFNALCALKHAGLIFYEGESERGTSDYSINIDKLIEYRDRPDGESSAPGESGAPGVVNPVHQGGESSAPESSFNHPFKQTCAKVPRTTESYQKEIMSAYERGLKRQHSDLEDRINQYPEDIRPIIRAVCEIFHLSCPCIRGSKSGLWIRGARDLKDACGEFQASVLDEIAKDFEDFGRKNGGTVPFTIGGPHSLVNTAVGKAGQLRTNKLRKVRSEERIVPKGAEVVYAGGKQYQYGGDGALVEVSG